MKIRIEITLEIDAERWAQEFGVDADDKAALREDVKTYFAGTVQEQAERIGVLEET